LARQVATSGQQPERPGIVKIISIPDGVLLVDTSGGTRRIADDLSTSTPSRALNRCVLLGCVRATNTAERAGNLLNNDGRRKHGKDQEAIMLDPRNQAQHERR
jgi:hypothetical protein